MPRHVAVATRGPLRLLRGLLVGTGGTGISVVSHLAAGGSLPGGVPTALVATGAIGICWWLSDRRWTQPRLFGVLLVVQSAMHLALTAPGAGEHGSLALMLAAHAVATVMTARLLLSGEAWVWELLDTLTIRVARRLRPLALLAREPSAPAERLPDGLLAGELALLPWRRGPPAPLPSR
jgi:hypothetical protein